MGSIFGQQIGVGGWHGMLERGEKTPQNLHRGGEMLLVLMSLRAGAGLFWMLWLALGVDSAHLESKGAWARVKRVQERGLVRGGRACDV